MGINHTFSTLCIIRSSRSRSNKAPIYLRITIDGKRAEISTKEYVELEKWNREKGRVRGNSEEARRLNQRLDTWETKAKEYHNQFLRDGRRVNAQLIKEAVLGIASKTDDLLSYFEAHEDEVKSKVGIDYSLGTYKNYVASKKHLEHFLSQEHKGKLITLKDLDYDFIAGFESYLKLRAGNSNNGAIKHIQRLKKVVHLAIKRGKLDHNPFATYRIKKERKNREFLTADELQSIQSQDFNNATLGKVRDLFVFICYTGLSYSDLASLSSENLFKGIDGDLWVFIERQKTNSAIRIPILPPAKAILDKYQDYPESVNKGVLLPVMTNQKMNKYLKDIAKQCNIHKPITCHIGRHTFATTITLSNDIPIETVSQMLGHSSLRTTQIYAKVIEKKVSQDMSRLKLLYGSEQQTKTVNQ